MCSTPNSPSPLRGSEKRGRGPNIADWRTLHMLRPLVAWPGLAGLGNPCRSCKGDKGDKLVYCRFTSHGCLQVGYVCRVDTVRGTLSSRGARFRVRSDAYTVGIVIKKNCISVV